MRVLLLALSVALFACTQQPELTTDQPHPHPVFPQYGLKCAIVSSEEDIPHQEVYYPQDRGYREFAQSMLDEVTTELENYTGNSHQEIETLQAVIDDLEGCHEAPRCGIFILEDASRQTDLYPTDTEYEGIVQEMLVRAKDTLEDPDFHQLEAEHPIEYQFAVDQMRSDIDYLQECISP